MRSADGRRRFSPEDRHAGDIAASLGRLDRRWSRLVQVSRDPDLDPGRAGVPAGGVVLVRPDGHIGFRSPSADAGALAALDRHLSSYLIPAEGQAGEANIDFVDKGA